MLGKALCIYSPLCPLLPAPGPRRQPPSHAGRYRAAPEPPQRCRPVTERGTRESWLQHSAWHRGAKQRAQPSSPLPTSSLRVRPSAGSLHSSQSLFCSSGTTSLGEADPKRPPASAWPSG